MNAKIDDKQKSDDRTTEEQTSDDRLFDENTVDLVSEKVLAGYSLLILFSHHTSSQCFKARRFDRVAPAIFK